MRKALSLIFTVLATVCFVSCDPEDPQKNPNNPDDNPDDPVIMDATFELLSPDAWEVEWRSDTLVLEYEIKNPTPTGSVFASSEAAWLTFNTQTYGQVTVFVAENEEFEERVAEIVLDYEGIEHKITVTQSSRVWDLEAICTTCLSAYNYGSTTTPNTGLYFAQFMISDKSESFDPEGHYFMFGITFPQPEDPEDTSIPEGTYNFGYEYVMGELTLLDGNSRYFTYPGGQALGKHYTSGRLVVSKDGDNYIIDLDANTEDDLSVHARYEGPIEFTKYW